jgi:hypothetical protein
LDQKKRAVATVESGQDKKKMKGEALHLIEF